MNAEETRRKIKELRGEMTLRDLETLDEEGAKHGQDS